MFVKLVAMFFAQALQAWVKLAGPLGHSINAERANKTTKHAQSTPSRVRAQWESILAYPSHTESHGEEPIFE